MHTRECWFRGVEGHSGRTVQGQGCTPGVLLIIMGMAEWSWEMGAG